ncbi:MAG: tetratricopeptide repeat protein [Candidatus Riflebacteria bacterium]|nr:tetratricopeptide repeat protein [Candidatus Riflebacteria bacterium]
MPGSTMCSTSETMARPGWPRDHAPAARPVGPLPPPPSPTVRLPGRAPGIGPALRWGRLGCLFLAAAWLGAVAAPAAPPGQRYRRAMEALQKEDFRRGVNEYYKFLLLEEPVLGEEARTRDLEPARRHFQAAVDGGTQDPKAPFFLSLIRRSVGRVDEGHRLLDPIRERHPRSFVLTFVKGEFALAGGDAAAAAREFERLRQVPRAAPLLALGLHLLKRSPPGDERGSRLRQAFRHFDLGEYAKARQAFEALTRDFPDDPEPFGGLAEVLMATEDWPAAERVVDTFQERCGRSPLPRLREAHLRFRRGHHLQVIRLLGPVTDQDPDNDAARTLLAESLFAAEKLEAAADQFLVLYQRDPLNTGVLDRLVTCLCLIGREETAIPLVRLALDRRPKDEYLTFQLAQLYERRDYLEEAQGLYLQVFFRKGPLAEDARARADVVLERIIEQKALGAELAHPASAAAVLATGSLPASSSWVNQPRSGEAGSPPGGSGPSAFSETTPQTVRFSKKRQESDLRKRLSNMYR